MIMQKKLSKKSILNRYQVGLETSMRGSDFILDCVHLLCYKCHRINPNHDRSCIDSPGLRKNPKNNDKFYQERPAIKSKS